MSAVGHAGSEAGWEIHRRDLAACRVAFGIALLAIKVLEPAWIWSLPAPLLGGGAVEPSGFALLPATAAMVAFRAAWTALGVALILGVAVPPVSIALALLGIVEAAWQASTGKINHHHIITVALVLLAATGWGSPPHVFARRAAGGDDPEPDDGGIDARARALGIHLLATAIALYLLSGALPKVASGWLDPSRRAVPYHALLRAVASYGRLSTITGNWALFHLPGWSWEVLDWATIAIEGGLVLLLRRPARFRDLLACALVLHGGIAFMLSIPYWSAPLSYLPVMLSGRSARDGSLVDRLRSAPAGVRLGLLLGALAMLAAIPLVGQATEPAAVLEFWICEVGAVLGLGHLAASAARLAGLVPVRD